MRHILADRWHQMRNVVADRGWFLWHLLDPDPFPVTKFRLAAGNAGYVALLRRGRVSRGTRVAWRRRDPALYRLDRVVERRAPVMRVGFQHVGDRDRLRER